MQQQSIKKIIFILKMDYPKYYTYFFCLWEFCMCEIKDNSELSPIEYNVHFGIPVGLGYNPYAYVYWLP